MLSPRVILYSFFFFFQAEDGIRDLIVTGVQTCALPIYPRALGAEAAVEMATISGARALHLEAEIGSLESGKKADLIVLGMNAPHAVPLYQVYSQIVYALKASDVETVVIGGRTGMENGRGLTLNQAEVVAEARKYGAKVRASLAAPAK